MNISIKTFFLVSLSISTGILSAQDQYLTIEDCYNPKYYPTRLRGVQWIPGSHKFSQVKGEALVATDAYSKKDDTLFTLATLNASLALDDARVKSIPAVSWKDNNTLWFTTSNKLFLYTVSTQTAILKRKFGDANQAMEVAPESLNIATVEGDNLLVHTAYGSRKLTEDGANTNVK